MAMKQFFILMTMTYTSVAAACVIPKSDYKNVQCTAQRAVFLATKDNGEPVALLNRHGKKSADLFAFDFVLASHLNQGLLPVKKGNKIGYINTQGKIVIGIQYDSLTGQNWARRANNDRIIVKKNGSFGVIDLRGQSIVPFDKSIDDISDFSENTAIIYQNNQQIHINKDGKRLQSKPNNNPTKPNNSPLSDNKSPPKPTTKTNNPQPLAQFFAQRKNGKWGFVDQHGTPMIRFAFDEVRPFSENLAGVRVGGYWGFINYAGELVIDFRFDDKGIIIDSTDNSALPMPFLFQQGKAWIGNLHNGTKLCIDPQGTNINC